jgi:GT2 family glycosyltransferase
MMDALRTAAAAAEVQLQVIVVDNASSDGSADFVRANWPDVQLIANSTNVGFGRANNQALPLLRGSRVLLLNTDAFVSAGSLRTSLARMEQDPRCGLVGLRLVGRDGAVQPSCRYFPTPWNIFLSRTGLSRFFPRVQMVDEPGWDDRKPAECDWVPGAFLLIRREVIEQVGLFDPRYFLYYEEVDFCRAARSRGWKVCYVPDADVIHIGGESAKSTGALTGIGRQLSTLQIESELLYFRKQGGVPRVMAYLLLVVAGDTIRAAKRLLGARHDGEAPFALTRLAGRLLARTRLASQPTR